jgi:tetratricopeptide (TPR) repeat protein
MSEKNEPIFDNEEFLILLRKYEKMKSSDDAGFFDVEEFEQIIDYYLDEFQYDKAKEAADLGSKQHPASVEIKYKVVHIYLEQGMGKMALEMLEHIPEWEYTNAEFFYLKGTALCLTGKIHDAEKSFDHGLSLAADETFEALLNIAIAFENARQYNLAVKYLEQAHKISPEFLSVIYDLGYFNERLDHFDKSIEYYQAYLDIDPFSENVWYNLGVAYFKMDQYKKAIEAYDYSIAINPDYASAYFNKANTYGSLEHYELAIETIKEFLEIEPENQQALNFLGDCYEQINKYDKALEVYKKVIELDNTDSEGWFGAGMVQYQLNKFDEAVIYLLKALEFDPQNADYWINLGYIYEEAEKMPDAVKCYRQVTRIDRNDYDGWISLCGLLINMQEYDKAFLYLKDAYTLFPEDDKITLFLSKIHFELGNDALGLKFLEITLKNAPGRIKDFKVLRDESSWNEATKKLIRKYIN